MGKDYEFKLKIPTGSSEAVADDLDSLALLVPSGISKRIAPETTSEGEGLEASAHRLLKIYRDGRNRNNRPASRATRAGLDLDLIKCYLQNMTIKEAVKWLKKEKKFKTSHTAIGRHWAALGKLGAASMRYPRE